MTPTGEKKQLIGPKAAESLQFYPLSNEQVRTRQVKLEGSLDRNKTRELVQRLRGALTVEVQRVVLDFKDGGAFSREALVFLSEKGFLRTGEEGLCMAINAPEQNR